MHGPKAVQRPRLRHFVKKHRRTLRQTITIKTNNKTNKSIINHLIKQKTP
jgi:hypothetical protein